MLSYETAHQLFEYLPNGELKRKVTTSSRAIKGMIVGSIGIYGYKYVSIGGKKYYNHRVVWLLHHKNMAKYIDHIDGNKLNNKIENLRECNLTENSCNSSIRKDSTSGYKGVNFFKPKNKWRARISMYGKEYHFGYFDEIDEAIVAVKNGRIKIHKEFARHA